MKLRRKWRGRSNGANFVVQLSKKLEKRALKIDFAEALKNKKKFVISRKSGRKKKSRPKKVRIIFGCKNDCNTVISVSSAELDENEVSDDGISRRNLLITKEAEATWDVGLQLGMWDFN